MSEAVVENEVKEISTKVAPTMDPFNDSSWSEKIPEAAPIIEEKKPVIEKIPNEEIVDELEYLEKQTGFKSWDEVKALKTEAEQLRAKAQTPAERKFANEKSKQLAEAWEAGETDKVFDYLNTERQLKKAADLPAAEAIKLHLKQTKPHYSQKDVDDIFEERYSAPRKPVLMAGEEQEAFDERMQEYNSRVEKVNRAIERDAVDAKQELAKQITELVLPKINVAPQPGGPTQEELDNQTAYVENYNKSIPSAAQSFNGFTTTFKDDIVEIPISFVASEDDRKSIQQFAEDFAKAGLNANAFMAPAWLNKDGSINVKQMGEDLYLLKNRDKIFQKIANESGTKRLAHQMKLNSNIKVKGEGRTTVIEKPDVKKAQADYIWENG